MPELDKYAFAVNTSFLITLAIILGLLAFSIMRQRKIRAQIRAITKEN